MPAKRVSCQGSTRVFSRACSAEGGGAAMAVAEAPARRLSVAPNIDVGGAIAYKGPSMWNPYRFLAQSDHPVAKGVRDLRRKVYTASLPVPGAAVKPALWAYLLTRELS